MKVRFNLELYGQTHSLELEFNENRVTIDELEAGLNAWVKQQVGTLDNVTKWVDFLD